MKWRNIFSANIRSTQAENAIAPVLHSLDLIKMSFQYWLSMHLCNVWNKMSILDKYLLYIGYTFNETSI